MRLLLLILTTILSFAIANADVNTIERDGIKYELHPDSETGDSSYWSTFFSRVENWCAVSGYDDSVSGEITIPAIIEDGDTSYKVRKILKQAFSNSENLSAVNLPNTLICIEEKAFEGSGIKSIDLSNTMVDYIHSKTFANCASLASVNLGGRVRIIWEDAFKSCVEVKELKISPILGSIKSLPPCLEDLYIAYNGLLGLPSQDYPNTNLHVLENTISKYVTEYGENFKSIRTWDYLDGGMIEPNLDDLDTEYVYLDWPVGVAYYIYNMNIGQTISIHYTFQNPEGTFNYIQYVEWNDYDLCDVEYDGADVLLVTLKDCNVNSFNYYNPIYIGDVKPIYPVSLSSYQIELATGIRIIPHLGPDYPTSIEFKNKEVRIKPFEFYYQEVQVLPEGSTMPELTWSSSNPAIATVTKDGRVYPFVEEGTVTISATDGKDLSASYTAIIDVNATGIDSVETDACDNPVEYYNLQGVQVEEAKLTPGLYIRRQGGNAEKVVIK